LQLPECIWGGTISIVPPSAENTLGASAPEVTTSILQSGFTASSRGAERSFPHPVPSKVLIIRPLRRVSRMTEVTCSSPEACQIHRLRKNCDFGGRSASSSAISALGMNKGFYPPETAKICFSAASTAIAANAVESMQRHRRFRPFFTNP